MTSDTLPEGLRAIAGRDRLGADEVLDLRRGIFRDGVVSEREAEALVDLDTKARSRSPEWNSFFVEALTDYVVRQRVPVGYVDEANADWLMSAITCDGHLETRSELELLIKVMETAQSTPARLSAFALSEIGHAVVHAEGPVLHGKLVKGVIGEVEVTLMRRILYAFGGVGSVAITREEADVLFDLNDQTAGADNHPAWSDLFVKAIANCLMAAAGYQVPNREEALRREAFLDERPGVSDFMARMVSGGLRAVWDAYRMGDIQDAWAERNAAHADASHVAEQVTPDEARWLADRIGRDGALHENEEALLAFLREAAPDLPPALQTLVDAA
ncbi:MAG: hypothetical protein AAFX39_08125 [Pseudomonadota bacterium]